MLAKNILRPAFNFARKIKSKGKQEVLSVQND